MHCALFEFYRPLETIGSLNCHYLGGFTFVNSAKCLRGPVCSCSPLQQWSQMFPVLLQSCVQWGGGLGSPVSYLISEMGSHGGEDRGRTAEALCLEVRPLQRATLGVRLAHRKAFSLDYMDTHRETHYRGRYSPQGFSHLLFPDCDVLTGHTLRSTASQQASTSPCHRISPPAQPPYSRAVMLSRRSDPDPVRGSREDQEAGSSFNHRAPLMSLSSSEEEQEVGERAGRVTSSLLTPTPTGERRLSKRERKRLKSLRRRQRRRERCRQNQQQENVQVKHKHTHTRAVIAECLSRAAQAGISVRILAFLTQELQF